MKSNKHLLLLALCISSSTLVGCGNSIEASFNDYLISKITVGETINFNNYINYADGLTISYTYSNKFVENQKCDSMYFITEIVSPHTFNFTFSDGSSKKSLSCNINVVPETPRVIENENAVYVNKGETLTFDELYDRSGINALPFGHVDIKFIGVTYSADYESSNIKISTDPIKSEYRKFSNETNFTFDKFGKYIFDLEAYNSEGKVNASMQVSVFDAYNKPIEGLEFNGLIKGEKNVVSLVKSNISSKLSYLYFENAFSLSTTKKYTIECEFVGKHAPQIIIGADAKTGNKYNGKGLVISLEEDNKNQFGIYGYDRFESANLSPSRSEGNTFSRKNLLDGVKYKWQVVFRLTGSEEDRKVCIMSYLYQNEKLFRTYNWASISISDFIEQSYIGYLGSSLDDALFAYSHVAEEDI